MSPLSKDWPGTTANSRPLIFVCRGLGGLVVKEVRKNANFLFTFAAENNIMLGITHGRKTKRN